MKRTLSILSLALALAGAAWAQQQGPLTPPPKREIKRLPAEGPAETPPVPAEEMIRKFTQKEDEFKRACDGSSFQLTIRVQEYGDDGSPAGEAQITTEIYTKADGKRYARVLAEPPSTLKAISPNMLDLSDLAALPHFVLTTDQLAKYDLTYAGQQQVDEIGTYMFRVQPKSVDRRERRFEGLVWVDDRDFEIVKTYGRFVSEVTREEMFSVFETYREVVDGKNRLPTYVRSDGEMKFKNGSVRLKLTMRYAEYKPSAPPPAK